MARPTTLALFTSLALTACGGDDEVRPPVSATQVAVGVRHTCALRLDGSVRCWGFNLDEQTEPPSGRFVRLTAGTDTNCGIRDDGALSCWGSPFRETNEDAIEPPSGRFVEVALGYSHACALREDGTAVCWGDQQDPVVAAELTTAPSVALHGLSLGNAHACALDSNDAIICRGNPATTGWPRQPEPSNRSPSDRPTAVRSILRAELPVGADMAGW